MACQLRLPTVILLAQISDPHIKLDDDTSQPALAAAVARVLTLKPLPAAVLVTGDIADSDAPAEHERARELMSPLPMPVHLLAGNHDPGLPAYTASAGGLRIVACNTAQPGRDDGALDVDWLRAQLVPDVPTVIAMHHPPIDIGITFADEIGLPAADREALAELLRRSPQVKGVVAGHVHRTVAGTLGGCPVLTCTSTNIQAALDFTTSDMLLTHEPPSILVHAWLGAQFVTHVHPVGSDPG
jgi:3',5'-cyclic AMP phosphodiesterase CpdA